MLFTKQNTYREDIVMLMGDTMPLPIITVHHPEGIEPLLVLSCVPADFMSRDEIGEVVKGCYSDREIIFSDNYDALSKTVSEMMPPSAEPIPMPIGGFSRHGAPPLIQCIPEPVRKGIVSAAFAEFKRRVDKLRLQALSIQTTLIRKPKVSRTGKRLKPWER